MKKIIFGIVGIILLTSNAFSNEIQIFTANTMHLTLEQNATTEKVFAGTYEDFNKQYAEIMKSKLVSTAAWTAYGGAMVTASAFAAGAGSIKGDSIPGLVVGLAIVAVAGISKMAYDYITADNEYVILTIAVNSTGDKTMLQTHIVSNYAITLQEAEKLASTDQKNQFIKGNQ